MFWKLKSNGKYLKIIKSSQECKYSSLIRKLIRLFVCNSFGIFSCFIRNWKSAKMGPIYRDVVQKLIIFPDNFQNLTTFLPAIWGWSPPGGVEHCHTRLIPARRGSWTDNILRFFEIFNIVIYNNTKITRILRLIFRKLT